MVGTMYIYTYVGLSALLVSTYRAMREPYTVERVTGLAPRFLYLYANNLSINRQEGAIGKIMIKHEKTIYFEINARLSLGSYEHGD